MPFRRLVLFFAIGAITGTVLDRIHTFFGVLRYARPFVWDEAWWVPLLMGGATVALTATHTFYRRIFDEPADGTAREIVTASVWFVVLYLASGLAKGDPIALTILFVSVFLARALRTPKSRAMWALAATAAIFGALVEIVLTRAGAFEHLHANALGLPYWLGGLYLQAALLVRSMERYANRVR